MKSSPAGPTVSIIIPVYRGGDPFRQCLLSVSAVATPALQEVIVVADGDPDGSWHLAEEFGFCVVKKPVSEGPARARNLGAHTARGDILFFVDADVTIGPDAVGQIVTTFQQQPDVAALFGTYDDQPSEPNFLSRYKNLFHHYVHQNAKEEAFTFWAACGAIRRDVFLDMGGFDESYRKPSVEDIELGYRLKKAGHRIRLVKSLQVKHLKRWGVSSLLLTDFFGRALPWSDLILRERRFIDDLNIGYRSRFSVVAVYGFLSALVGALWWPVCYLAAALAAVLLAIFNASVYRFFKSKQGLLFAIGVVPWHWFYYAYGGLAFAIAVVRYLIRGSRSRGGTSQVRKVTE